MGMDCLLTYKWCLRGGWETDNLFGKTFFGEIDLKL